MEYTDDYGIVRPYLTDGEMVLRKEKTGTWASVYIPCPQNTARRKLPACQSKEIMLQCIQTPGNDPSNYR